MAEIRDGKYAFTITGKSGEDDPILVLRCRKAVLTSKRIEAFARFGEMALPKLRDDPEFAAQAAKIDGLVGEIGALEEEIGALEGAKRPDGAEGAVGAGGGEEKEPATNGG